MLIEEIPECIEKGPFLVTSCEHNSTCVKEGSLFFALKGQKYDGHDFLQEVAGKGAIGAVVDADYQGKSFGLFLFRSKNVLLSLQKLAKNILQTRKKQKIIAVTGSVGKTTTKEFIATLLSRHYKVDKSPGSCNSQVTFPLTILNSKEDADILLLEMGMSQKKELQRLVDIAPADIAVITKITYAHAANFPQGITEIAKEKMRIFSPQKTKYKIWHRDILHYASIEEGHSYSLRDKSAEFYIEKKQDKILFYEKQQKKIEIVAPFPEEPFLENMLAAVAVARCMGVSYNDIIQDISCLRTLPLRLEKVEKNQILFINDCYNASFASMEAALLTLQNYEGRKIAVLGEMRDLGNFSFSCHQKIGYLALQCVDEIVCFGKKTLPIVEIFTQNQKPVYFFRKKQLLIEFLQKYLQKKDVVLIKGARSCQLEKLVDLLDCRYTLHKQGDA